MDALIVLGLLLFLPVAAELWGYDSREALGSKERDLASYGVRWSARPGRRAAAPASGRSATWPAHRWRKVACFPSHGSSTIRHSPGD